MSIYCLADRHDYPNNPKPIFKGWNFHLNQPTFTGNGFTEALSKLKKGEEVYLYTSGLVIALTYFLKEAIKYKEISSLYVLNYTKDLQSYTKTKLW